MRIAVFGAGAWGTALAQHAAAHHDVLLWGRDAAQIDAMRRARRNLRYLPEQTLAAGLSLSADFDQTLRWLDDFPSLLVIATPMAGLRPMLQRLNGRLPAQAAGLVWLCKGVEADSGHLPHEVAAQELRGCAYGAVSGPSFAQEVAAGLPVALTAASADARLLVTVQQALHLGAVRIYRSDDLIGVELGGALKNVMAIAAGICDGLALGHNARAALITRGLAEIARLGAALGARSETFMGLAGLGDLILTCTGDLSRNRRVGLGLAADEPLADIVARLGHVAEGVLCAAATLQRARDAGVDMPIVAAVNAVLAGEQRPREAVLALLAREPRREAD